MTGLGLGLMILLGGLIILFFLVMFLASNYYGLASLRNRCKDTRLRLDLALEKNQNRMQHTEELISAENEISRARQAYNDSVMPYNQRRKVFPANLIATLFNFAPAEPCVIDEPE